MGYLEDADGWLNEVLKHLPIDHLDEAKKHIKAKILESYKNGLKKDAGGKGEVLDVGDTFERARQELSAIEKFLAARGTELKQRKKDEAGRNE